MRVCVVPDEGGACARVKGALFSLCVVRERPLSSFVVLCLDGGAGSNDRCLDLFLNSHSCVGTMAKVAGTAETKCAAAFVEGGGTFASISAAAVGSASASVATPSGMRCECFNASHTSAMGRYVRLWETRESQRRRSHFLNFRYPPAGRLQVVRLSVSRMRRLDSVVAPPHPSRHDKHPQCRPPPAISRRPTAIFPPKCAGDGHGCCCALQQEAALPRTVRPSPHDCIACTFTSPRHAYLWSGRGPASARRRSFIPSTSPPRSPLHPPRSYLAGGTLWLPVASGLPRGRERSVRISSKYNRAGWGAVTTTMTT
ncbi:hypothetical protein BC628DRAFT_627324 [Trametes gibbosa]|nr:hypothetical protein BC628DRAFT_627324 [Trametes gibbosa]